MLAPLLAAFVLQASPQKPIEVKDGETVVYRGTSVRFVHRIEGTVRIIYDAANRWIAILYDSNDAGAAADGKVDGSFRFDDVDGVWPLGERWQGNAVIDEYQMPQGMLRAGVGIRTDGGLIQLFSGSPGAQPFQDPSAAAVLHYHSGGGGGMGSRMSFDQAEQFLVQQAAREVQMREARKANPGQIGGFSTSTTMIVGANPAPGGIKVTPAGMQPVRVGGAIATPRKVVDVRPVYPPIAQSAGVQGVVILEITIGTDGGVADAKVLRSIPLLDQAALDCVRQWKYEPTSLNGAAVPVIMTVTVSFSLQ